MDALNALGRVVSLLNDDSSSNQRPRSPSANHSGSPYTSPRSRSINHLASLSRLEQSQAPASYPGPGSRPPCAFLQLQHHQRVHGQVPGQVPLQNPHRPMLRPHPRPHPHPSPSPHSGASEPNTPELLRSASYDSQMSNDPLSPLTPSTAEYPFATSALYPSLDAASMERGMKRKAPAYDEDKSSSEQGPAKRYPCRFREMHGCTKTFTTSGHASRHSKIHTAEKSVPCKWEGCTKKFTRADNMKQHYETHKKDKSRSSSTSSRQHHHRPARSDTDCFPAVSASASTSPCRRPQRPSLRTSMSAREASTNWEGHLRNVLSPPLLSPASSAAMTPSSTRTPIWPSTSVNSLPLSRPPLATPPSHGLDALALAVACKEGDDKS